MPQSQPQKQPVEISEEVKVEVPVSGDVMKQRLEQIKKEKEGVQK